MVWMWRRPSARICRPEGRGASFEIRTPPDLGHYPAEQINEAINLHQSEIEEQRVLMQESDRLSANLSGARQYKSMARGIVLQAQRIEELTKANVFSR